MKYFIAYVTVLDGNHEHVATREYARINAKELEKELNKEIGKDRGYFTWGDGEAIVKKYYIKEISKYDYVVLSRHL